MIVTLQYLISLAILLSSQIVLLIVENRFTSGGVKKAAVFFSLSNLFLSIYLLNKILVQFEIPDFSFVFLLLSIVSLLLAFKNIRLLT